MGKIIVDPSEFFDVIMVFFHDMLSTEKEIVMPEERIKNIIDILKKKGMGTRFNQYYLSLSSDQRVLYKRIRDSFFNYNAAESVIKIDPKFTNDGVVTESDDFYKVKDAVRKCIIKMKKEKYGNPNRVITEEKLDKIIDSVLKEK